MALQVRNLIAQNLLIHSDKNQPLKVRLRHQQPVKGIAMQWRKPSGPLGVFNGDGKGPESMNLYGSSNRSPKSQLSRSAFDGDLPNRHGTDEDLILRQGNGRVKRLRQFGIIRVPPQKGVRVEQQFHSL